MTDPYAPVAPAVEAALQTGVDPSFAVSAGMTPPPVPELSDEEWNKSPVALEWSRQHPVLALAMRGNVRALADMESIYTSNQKAQDAWYLTRERGANAPSSFTMGLVAPMIGGMKLVKHVGNVDWFDDKLEGAAYLLRQREAYDATNRPSWIGGIGSDVARSAGYMAGAMYIPGASILGSLAVAQVGENWDEFAGITDAEGKKLDHSLAGSFALVTGVAQAGLDTFSVSRGAAMYAPTIKRMLGPQVIGRMMKSTDGMAALNGFISRYAATRIAATAATEGATEGAQELIGLVGEWAAKNTADLVGANVFTAEESKLMRDGDWDQVVQAAKDGFAVGTVFAGVGEAARRGRGAARRSGDAQEAAAEVKANTEITEKLSAIAEKQPELAHAYAQKNLPRKGDVSLDALRANTLDPYTLDRLGIDAATLEVAIDAKGGVTVNMARVAALPKELRTQVYELYQSDALGMSAAVAAETKKAEDKEAEEASALVRQQMKELSLSKSTLRKQAVAAMSKEVKTRMHGSGSTPEEVAADWVDSLVKQAHYLRGSDPVSVKAFLDRRSVSMTQDALSGKTEVIPIDGTNDKKLNFFLSPSADASTLFHEGAHGFKVDYDNMAAEAAELLKTSDVVSLDIDKALAQPRDVQGKSRKRDPKEQQEYDLAREAVAAKRLVEEHAHINSKLPADPVKAQETFARWSEIYLRTGNIHNEKMAPAMHRVRTYFSAAYKDAQQIYDSYQAQTGEPLVVPSSEALDVFRVVHAGVHMAESGVVAFDLSPDSLKAMDVTAKDEVALKKLVEHMELKYAEEATRRMDKDRRAEREAARKQAEIDDAADPMAADIDDAKNADAQGVPHDMIASAMNVSVADVAALIGLPGREARIQERIKTLVPAALSKPQKALVQAKVSGEWMSRVADLLQRVLKRQTVSWGALQSQARHSLRNLPMRDALDVAAHGKAYARNLAEVRRKLALGNVAEAWSNLVQAEVHRQQLLESELIHKDLTDFKNDMKAAQRAAGGTYQQDFHEAINKLGVRMGIGAKDGVRTFTPRFMESPVPPRPINELIGGVLDFDSFISDADAPFNMEEAAVAEIYEMMGAGRALMHRGVEALLDAKTERGVRLSALQASLAATVTQTLGKAKRTAALENAFNAAIEALHLGKIKEKIAEWYGLQSNSVAGLRTFAALLEGGDPRGGASGAESDAVKLLLSVPRKADEAAVHAEAWLRTFDVPAIREEVARLTSLLAMPEVQRSLPQKPSVYHAQGRGTWTAQEVLNLVLLNGSPTGREAISRAYLWKLLPAETTADAESGTTATKPAYLAQMAAFTEGRASVSPSVVNRIWASLEPVFVELNEVHLKEYGYRQVGTDAIKDVDSPYNGGYFPIHRDFSTALLEEGEIVNPSDIDSDDPGQSVATKGMWPEKARADMLEDRSGRSIFAFETDALKVLMSHLKWSAHYVKVEEVAHEMQDVFWQATSQAYQPMVRLLGRDGMNTFQALMRNIRRPAFVLEPKGWRWALKLVGNATGALLARSIQGPVSGMVTNMSGLTRSVGMKVWLDGLPEMRNPEMIRLFANSPAVVSSMHVWDERHMSLLSDAVQETSTVHRKTREAFMVMWAASDFSSLGPAWAGTYKKALREGKSITDAKEEADAAIRSFVPAVGVDKSMHDLSNNNWARSFSTFTSWMRKVHNRDRLVWAAFNSGKMGWKDFALHHAMHYFLPVAILEGAKAAMSPGDDDEALTKVALGVGINYVGWVPLVGVPAVAGIQLSLGASAPGVSRQPGLDVPYALFGDGLKAGKNGEYGEAAWQTARFIGIVSGIPALEIIEKAREIHAAAEEGGIGQVIGGKGK